MELNFGIPDNVLFDPLSGEAVLLNLTSGKYYGLNEVGTRLYASLSQNASFSAAYQTLLDEYDVEPERLRQDLLTLVDQLLADGLLRVLDQASVQPLLSAPDVPTPEE